AATRNVSVTATNDPPVVTVPGAQVVNQDTNLTINGISVADVDATTSQVTVSALHGKITLSGTSGLSFSVGDGTTDATMTFTGTISAINTALNGLVYRGNTGYTGPDTITVNANDQGNTGTGGAQSDNETIGVTVNATHGLKGDMNNDGVVDNFDIQPFELALTNPSVYLSTYPSMTEAERVYR